MDNTPATSPALKKRPRTALRTLIGVAIAIGAFIGVQAYFGRAAPTPPAFERSVTLAQAMDEGEAQGRPVLVLATADWCAPCQMFKRGALTDAEVTAWIGANAVPVTLDLTDGGTPESGQLGISSIPAMVLIRDGRPIAKREGGGSADAVLAWLREHAGATPAG